MSELSLGQARSFLSGEFKESCIGVLGDVGLDRFQFGSVDRISPEAPVPVLLLEREEEKIGLAGNVIANLATWADFAPIKSKLFTVTGVDAYSASLKKQISDLGDSLESYILESESRPTIVKTRFLAGSMHQLLRCDLEPKKPIESSEREKLMASLSKTGSSLNSLLIEDYAKGLLDEFFLQEVIQWANSEKIKTFVDPHVRSHAGGYKGAYLISPNVLECEQILGMDLKKGSDSELSVEAARILQERFQIENVVLTRSSFGMTLLNSSGEATHFPAPAKEVYDVTGAGDTAIAMITASHSAGFSLETACSLATAASSVVVSKVGPVSPSGAEILKALEELSEK